MTPLESRPTLHPVLVEAIRGWLDDPADSERARMVEDLLPGLLDEEAERALDTLAYAGDDPDTTRERLAPYLPRLGNGYLEPHVLYAIDLDAAAAVQNGDGPEGPDVFRGLIAAHTDLALGDDERGDTVLYARDFGDEDELPDDDDPRGDVIVQESPEIEGAWKVEGTLRDAPGTVVRFALLTRRFGDLHLLLGCPVTGRRDALVCRHRPRGPDEDDLRTGWRDEALPAARALIDTIMAGLDETAPLPRVYLNHMPEHGWLTALEFGRVDDAQGPDAWHGLTEEIGLRVQAGRVVGFALKDTEAFDPDEHPELWRGPRFCAPQLGLERASVNEIFVAATALYGEQPSVNRLMFGAAIRGEGEDALQTWLQCLQAGDGMAHYALGYTLLELGRHHEAYRHLRYYTEISPAAAWNWWYRAKAATALGLVEEARDCYTRAIELDEDDETGAADDLAALGE